MQQTANEYGLDTTTSDPLSYTRLNLFITIC